jgi:hypothetical protein
MCTTSRKEFYNISRRKEVAAVLKTAVLAYILLQFKFPVMIRG